MNAVNLDNTLIDDIEKNFVEILDGLDDMQETMDDFEDRISRIEQALGLREKVD